MKQHINRAEKVWSFKFRTCEETGKLLWPFSKVWHCFYKNHAGAIVGAPPIEMDFWLSDHAFMVECLKGNID